ncbi:hypothetical protein GCM10027168_26250 [Streptomyces capparidis]
MAHAALAGFREAGGSPASANVSLCQAPSHFLTWRPRTACRHAARRRPPPAAPLTLGHPPPWGAVGGDDSRALTARAGESTAVNLRRRGGLGEDSERAARRTAQLAALDPDRRPAWPIDWQRHYAMLRPGDAAEGTAGKGAKGRTEGPTPSNGV